MKATIFEPRHNAKRIKVHVPFKAVEWRKRVKLMDSSFFHYEQKLWSVVNTKENLQDLTDLFKGSYVLKPADNQRHMPKFQLEEDAQGALAALEKKLILKGYSPHTLRSYKAEVARFFSYFAKRDLKKVTKEEIEGYVYHLKSKYKISDSKQNIESTPETDNFHKKRCFG